MSIFRGNTPDPKPDMTSTTNPPVVTPPPANEPPAEPANNHPMGDDWILNRLEQGK